MKHFLDPLTNAYWSLDDDVVVTEGGGGLVFNTAEGELLTDVPSTLIAVDEIPVVPLPQVTPVPRVVSRFQGREAMWQTTHGDTSLFEAAELVINHPDTPAMYKRAWADLQEFREDSEMLASIATALGLSEQDRFDLFTLASGIKA